MPDDESFSGPLGFYDVAVELFSGFTALIFSAYFGVRAVHDLKHSGNAHPSAVFWTFFVPAAAVVLAAMVAVRRWAVRLRAQHPDETPRPGAPLAVVLVVYVAVPVSAGLLADKVTASHCGPALTGTLLVSTMGIFLVGFLPIDVRKWRSRRREISDDLAAGRGIDMSVLEAAERQLAAEARIEAVEHDRRLRRR